MSWCRENCIAVICYKWYGFDEWYDFDDISEMSGGKVLLFLASVYCPIYHYLTIAIIRVGRGGKNWFLPLILTGLNRLAETPIGKKLVKTQMTKTVHILVSNCLKCTNVGLDVIRTYCALCFIGFLLGDCLKCVYFL